MGLSLLWAAIGLVFGDLGVHGLNQNSTLWQLLALLKTMRS